MKEEETRCCLDVAICGVSGEPSLSDKMENSVHSAVHAGFPGEGKREGHSWLGFGLNDGF